MRGYIAAATSQLYQRGPAFLLLPYHYDVLAIARQFLDADKDDVAVIMAQTACEIATDDLVTALLRLRRLPADLESWITARIERAATLRSNVLYNLYVALSGDDLKQGQPALWDAYERHIALRNAIVHKAKTHASKQQATDGCNMTEALIHHFETVRARVIGTNP
jgi:hypothetical protein